MSNVNLSAGVPRLHRPLADLSPANCRKAAPPRTGRVDQTRRSLAAASTRSITAAAKTAAALPADLVGDIFASADYRRAIAGTYVARAVAAAASGR